MNFEKEKFEFAKYLLQAIKEYGARAESLLHTTEARLALFDAIQDLRFIVSSKRHTAC